GSQLDIGRIWLVFQLGVAGGPRTLAVFARDGVEIETFTHRRPPQAVEPHNQIFPNTLSLGGQPAVAALVQRLRDRRGGGGDHVANEAFNAGRMIGWGSGWGGRKNADGGGGLHGALAKAQ